MKIEKRPILPDRLRRIDGNFSYIPFRFLRDGFFGELNQHEKLIYFLLVMVSDRQGLSYYSQDKMSTLLEMDIDDFIEARQGLIDKELIAFDGLLFQVLSLPDRPVIKLNKALENREDFMEKDRLTIRGYLNETLHDKDPGRRR